MIEFDPVEKKWSDKFTYKLKNILSECFIKESSQEIDMHENVDLIINPATISCRVRNFKYFENHAHEFTIRSSRSSGHETELHKIIDGKGDYILYAFAEPDNSDDIHAWVLIDLKKFRSWYTTYLMNHSGEKPGMEITSANTTFTVFDLTNIEPSVIKDMSDNLKYKLNHKKDLLVTI
jgi:hypothetical protein